MKQPDPIPEHQDSDIEVLDFPPVSLVAPERSEKAKGKQRAVHADGSGSDVEIGEVRKHKKGKTKDTEKEMETRERTKTKVVKPKRISPSDDIDETHSKTKVKSNSRKRTSPDPPASKKSKVKSSQPKEDSTKEDSKDAANTEMDTAPKKKKRKINLFGSSQPATFDWNALGQVFLLSLMIEWLLTPSPY